MNPPHEQESLVTAQETADARRWPALFTLCVGMLMIVLDVTVVNVALPSIQTDLGFSQSDLAWVVNAYLISFGGLLLLAGRLGDLIGRRRVFLTGLALFTAASLLCGLAQSQGMLIGARFVQGVGGAMTSAVILGMIVTMFPDPREQAKAIGIYGFVASAGGSIGLLAGGVLTEAISWNWIFYINLPIAIGTAIAAVRLIAPDQGIGIGRGADVLGATLVTGSLMLGVYTIVKASEHGWVSAHTLVLGAVAVALLAAFLLRQARARNPLMPLRVFRSRNLSGANLVQIMVVAGIFGMFFLGTLYLERVLDFDPLQIGFAFLPSSLVMGFFSAGVSARLIARYGMRSTLVPALVLMAAGLALFARVPVEGSYWTDVLPAVVVLGAGAGLAFPTLMMMAMAGVDPADAGLASGLVNTSAQVGGALGLAVLATLSSSRTEDLLAGGESTAAALTSGYQLAFAVGVGLIVAGIAIALAVLRPDRTNARTAPNRKTAIEGV
jgi:EmrB/QacA subfamily drug resistance transporter